MTGFEHITYEVSEGIATITLNRPDKLNAFTTIMQRDLVNAFDQVDSDDSVRATIVTGSGRGFCAGADLGSAPSQNCDDASAVREDRPDQIGGVPRDGGGVVALRIAATRKPVIGAINGAAVGVGATMTLPMDIRLASESARFGFVFARRGIVPEATSSWFLPRVVGISTACEWALTGRVFGAEEAFRGGLVSAVLPDDELLSRARAVALEIAENTSSVSVAATRQMLWSMLSEPSPWTAHLVETTVIRELKQGADYAEGVASFLEKRQPAFSMKVSEDFPLSAPVWPKRPEDLEARAARLVANP